MGEFGPVYNREQTLERQLDDAKRALAAVHDDLATAFPITKNKASVGAIRSAIRVELEKLGVNTAELN